MGKNCSGATTFQFTPLREGRHIFAIKFVKIYYFNSRPCGRGDFVQFSKLHSVVLFQFTPLREGRLPLPAGGSGGIYFNSRPCGRGDLQSLYAVTEDRISIHAPAGGATYIRRVPLARVSIFQFTPLREGRQL